MASSWPTLSFSRVLRHIPTALISRVVPIEMYFCALVTLKEAGNSIFKRWARRLSASDIVQIPLFIKKQKTHGSNFLARYFSGRPDLRDLTDHHFKDNKLPRRSYFKMFVTFFTAHPVDNTFRGYFNFLFADFFL